MFIMVAARHRGSLEEERMATRENMQPVTTAEARRHIAELVNRAAYGGERFVVTRHGKELVAIVPLGEVTLLDRLRRLLEAREYDAALREVRESGAVAWDDVRRELDL
jgi:prevent-host-death family protein